MKSSLKVDFCDRTGKGIEPVIKIFIDGTSEDPRDKLLEQLFKSLPPDGPAVLQFEVFGQKHVNTDNGLPVLQTTLILFKPEEDILTQKKG